MFVRIKNVQTKYVCTIEKGANKNVHKIQIKCFAHDFPDRICDNVNWISQRKQK